MIDTKHIGLIGILLEGMKQITLLQNRKFLQRYHAAISDMVSWYFSNSKVSISQNYGEVNRNNGE
jgi:hypothetical protein